MESPARTRNAICATFSSLEKTPHRLRLPRQLRLRGKIIRVPHVRPSFWANVGFLNSMLYKLPAADSFSSASSYARSPCHDSSSPASSLASSTFTGVKILIAISIPYVKINAHAEEKSTATICFQKKLESPNNNPLLPRRVQKGN